MVEEAAEDSLKMSACGETTPPLLPPQQPKKKRNLPGMPDPDAEVVALSPKTLLATNRFVCEICGKGFQRDQNLQLHRRGHNLPWKLKQRSSKEPRKRVYVCPEPSCVHHNAGRALGDLTGIKKHFSRKHGEKKWKCERCSKKYAVQSDWKAHMKTCGTREYKCDCGTLFSRRDSFMTHRAFCDVLAEESMRRQGNSNNAMVMMNSVVASPPPPPLTPSTTVLSPDLSVQSSELAENPIGVALSPPVPAAAPTPTTTSNSTNSGNNVISTVFASSSAVSQQPSSSFSSMMSTIPLPTRPVVLEPPPSLSLSSPIYLSNSNTNNPCPSNFYAHNHQSPAMSATALLQKAAQMGAAATSNASFLCSLGLPENSNGIGSVHQWDVVKQERNSNVAAGGHLGLGLHHSVDSMMGSSSIFGSKPTTLDFLGLGMGSSALLNSYGGGFHVGAAAVAASVAAAEAFGGGGGGGRSTSEETWDGSMAAERNEAA